MDAPPPQENVQPFTLVARHLRQLGLGAPAILAEDVDTGLLLLEDLGDDTFTRLLRQGEPEEPLYALAVDVLVHLHRMPTAEAIPDGLPPYDDDRLLDEASLLVDWYLPAMLGQQAPEAFREDYMRAWRKTLPLVHVQPPTLVLRDYHVDNLMLVKGRDRLATCGLLDFQDAVAGAAAYDLMSLLEDARRDISSELKARMLQRYRNAFPSHDWTVFDNVFAILSAQRHAKVIGIFTRLCVRDGKPIYLQHIPRVWRLLESSLRHPALETVAAWIDDHIPQSLRGIPTCTKSAK